jgi:hypothetical protein
MVLPVTADNGSSSSSVLAPEKVLQWFQEAGSPSIPGHADPFDYTHYQETVAGFIERPNSGREELSELYPLAFHIMGEAGPQTQKTVNNERQSELVRADYYPYRYFFKDTALFARLKNHVNDEVTRDAKFILQAPAAQLFRYLEPTFPFSNIYRDRAPGVDTQHIYAGYTAINRGLLEQLFREPLLIANRVYGKFSRDVDIFEAILQSPEQFKNVPRNVSIKFSVRHAADEGGQDSDDEYSSSEDDDTIEYAVSPDMQLNEEDFLTVAFWEQRPYETLHAVINALDIRVGPLALIDLAIKNNHIAYLQQQFAQAGFTLADEAYKEKLNLAIEYGRTDIVLYLLSTIVDENKRQALYQYCLHRAVIAPEGQLSDLNVAYQLFTVYGSNIADLPSIATVIASSKTQFIDMLGNVLSLADIKLAKLLFQLGKTIEPEHLLILFQSAACRGEVAFARLLADTVAYHYLTDVANRPSWEKQLQQVGKSVMVGLPLFLSKALYDGYYYPAYTGNRPIFNLDGVTEFLSTTVVHPQVFAYWQTLINTESAMKKAAASPKSSVSWFSVEKLKTALSTVLFPADNQEAVAIPAINVSVPAEPILSDVLAVPVTVPPIKYSEAVGRFIAENSEQFTLENLRPDLSNIKVAGPRI